MTSSPQPPDPYISGNERAAGPTPQRPQQLAWGPPTNQPQSGRRGLAPISTTLNSNSQRPSSSSQSPRNPWSPPATSLGTSNTILNRSVGRSPSISSSGSPFSPPNAGQPVSQAGSHLRNTTSAQSQTISSAASFHGSGPVGSSSVLPARLPRGSPSIPQSTASGSSSALANVTAQSGSQTGSLSKIVVAQLVLLLSTIKEDKDKAKWDSQVDQIRKVFHEPQSVRELY